MKEGISSSYQMTTIYACYPQRRRGREPIVAPCSTPAGTDEIFKNYDLIYEL